MSESSNKKTKTNAKPRSKSKSKAKETVEDNTPTYVDSIIAENEHSEIIYSFHITNCHTNCTIQKLFESLDILRLGEVFQISIHTKYDGPINGKEKDKSSRQSEAFIYYKGSKHLIKKHPFLERILNRKKTEKKIELVHLLEGDTWKCEVNTSTNYHFRTDEYVQKRIIVQSICTTKNSTDINWIFREHGEVEQVDMVWVKSDQVPTPTRCQSYVYFKESSNEFST
jgi:hypothetical protein